MPKPVTGLNSINKPTSKGIGEEGIFAARVKFVMLDDKAEPEAFKKYGEWSSLGSIFFSRLNAPSPSGDFTTEDYAKPLFPNDKNYPLENEVVYILSLPSTEVQSNVNDKIYYYFQPVNVWGSAHHNAIPDPLFSAELPPSQQQDYEQTAAGSVRRVTDGGTEIDLGNTFKEKLDIKNLQPFEGDVIKEGRWGNSIRFGSTVNNSSIKNTWSKSGENGDPITIIRNGQHEDGKDPWVPQVEDINKDKSSIYLTSTQNIPIEPSSFKTKSYDNAPTNPSRFAGEQIILNSGRLFFNSKTDSILFSSADTINLNAVNSVNIDAPKTVIQSDEVLLGDKNAKESVILGDKFLSDLQKLLISLTTLTQALSTPIGTPIPFVPNMVIPAPAIDAKIKAQNMLNKIERYKSKVSKTK